MAFRSAYELEEQWMWTERAREQFRMKLGSNKKRMRRIVEDLHNASIRCHAAKHQASLFENGFIGIVQLVAMAKALTYHIMSVEPMYTGARDEQDIMATQALRAAQVIDLLLFREQGNERFGRVRLELRARGLFQTADMPGKLNRRQLKPEAQPQVGHLPFAGILNHPNHALCATHSIASRDNDPMHLFKALVDGVRTAVELGGINKLQVNAHVLAGFRVDQGIADADIRIPHGGVFARHRNGERWAVPLGMLYKRRKRLLV